MLFGIILSLSWATLGLALGSTSGLATQEFSTPSEFSLFTHGLLGRVQAASKIRVSETADAVLIRTKEWKWNPYLKNALNLSEWVDLGFEHRTRFEVYDRPWRSGQPLGRTDPQIQQRSRVRLGLNAGAFRFLFEGQDSRVHLDDPGDFVTTAIKNEMDMLQLFVSATAKNIFGTGLRTDLHLGRLTMDFGRRRLIARNDFRNTTNAFDGLHAQLAKANVWRIRAFLVEPVLRDDARLDEQSERSVFWGVYGETNQVQWLCMNVYYFGLNDQRSAVVSMQRTFSTFGGRAYKKPVKGQVDYEVETVFQAGTRGMTDHFAHFQHIDLGYSFNLSGSPRVVGFYDYASGDANASDSQSSNFDTLFGARRFEYSPTGNFGPFFRTNLSSPGWRVIAAPYKGWKVQLKHRVWYLATSRGSFASNGLRDTTGGSGNFLGHDVELRAQWKINDNLEFDAGYDHWFKGSYFDRLPVSTGLPPGGSKDSDYFYILTKFRI
ncbi:MAG: alginate export family protein [Nitrospirota bacterium]|nr:alginate export family protein [Nitrospirota bacterium]